MPDIKSDAQLRLMMGQVSEAVIESVSEIILKKLQDNIWRDTYMSDYYPNVEYYGGSGKPTGQFVSAFQWSRIFYSIKKLTRELYYDPSDMKYDPDTYLHGSKVGGDARESLADILNVDGYTSSWNWKKRKPYWDNTIRELFEGKIIEKEFQKALKQYGFKKI